METLAALLKSRPELLQWTARFYFIVFAFIKRHCRYFISSIISPAFSENAGVFDFDVFLYAAGWVATKLLSFAATPLNIFFWYFVFSDSRFYFTCAYASFLYGYTARVVYFISLLFDVTLLPCSPLMMPLKFSLSFMALPSDTINEIASQWKIDMVYISRRHWYSIIFWVRALKRLHCFSSDIIFFKSAWISSWDTYFSFCHYYTPIKSEPRAVPVKI